MDDSFPELPQVALHLGTVPFIVRWIVEQLPVHWAWNSDSPDTWWDPHMIHMDTDPHDQVNWYCTAMLELEHALARDFVLSPAAAEHGRQCVNGRHVICRSPGYMPSPSQAPPHGARVISGQTSWERQIESPIRLLNHLFEARRGFGAFHDASQTDLAPGRHDQSDGLGQKLPAVSADRTGHDPSRQGVASSATEHWCHLLPSTGQFSQSGRESNSETDEVEVRQPGRSLGPSPSTERDSDSRERLELPLLG